MDCSLCFDTEDYTSPEKWGMDDIPMWLAKIMSEEGVTGSFMVIGHKARCLRERKRKDVIAAMRKHEIAWHTNFGSEHPTLIEALAPLDWNESIRLFRERDEPCIRDLENIFDTRVGSMSSHGSSTAAPMSTVCGREFKLPWLYSSVTGLEDDFTWFDDCFQLPRETLVMDEAAYSNPAAITKTLADWDVQIAQMVAKKRKYFPMLLAHPLMIRAKQFNDALNYSDGKNHWPWKVAEMRSMADLKVAMQQFRRVIKWVKAHPDLNVRTLYDTYKTYGTVKKFITRDELAAYARDAEQRGSIPTRYTFSAAEALLAMAESVARKSVSSRSKVVSALGPLDDCIRYPDNERAWLDTGAVVTLAKALLADAAETGHLPTALRVPNGSGRMGLPTVFHVVRQAWSQLNSGQKKLHVQVPHLCGNLPDHAHEIEARHRVAWLDWPIHDIHTNLEKLSRDIRLQTWTYKMAYDGDDAPRR
jgi:hypothetical protein